MSGYFLEPKSSTENINVKLDLSHYATKADLRNATGVDASTFPKKNGLANLKSDVDKLDIDKLKNIPSNFSNLKNKVDKLDIGKLETTPLDLSDAVNVMQLSDVVKNEVIKKTVYNELFKKN